MAGKIVWFLLKAAAGGLISFFTPRVLLNSGVPLDQWAEAMTISLESLLWTITLLVLALLFFADRILHGWQVRKAHNSSAASAPSPEADPGEALPRPPDPPPTFEQDWERWAGRDADTLKVERDKGLSEALAYAACGLWGRSLSEVITDGGYPDAGDRWVDFRQRAHDGQLTVWGKRSSYEIWVKIDPEFWVDHQPKWFDLMRSVARTEPTSPGASSECFVDLMVSRTEFEKEWPHGFQPAE